MALLLLHLFTIRTWLSLLLIPLFASGLSFNYSSFSLSDDNRTYQRAYPDSNRVIQQPPNPATAGRATYNKPMHLWDKATRNLKDFATHFSFVIDSRKRTIRGDGIAFFLLRKARQQSLTMTKMEAHSVLLKISSHGIRQFDLLQWNLISSTTLGILLLHLLVLISISWNLLIL